MHKFHKQKKKAILIINFFLVIYRRLPDETSD